MRVSAKALWLVTAFSALISAVTPAMAEDTSAKAAADLSALLKNYESFQSDFIQIVVNENGNRVQESRGSLKAKRPGLFYWETRKPHSQFVVSNGETVEVYDPDLEQVTIHNLDERVQTTPALLLSGEVDNLNETYRVSSRSPGENIREFTLEPRSEDSLFVSLRLTFYNGELQEMRMRDSLAQLSVLSFEDIRLNAPVEDKAFTLNYPDSVDVIRDGA